MTFKIVSTRRPTGRSELCIVPSQWENKSQLRWPRHNAEFLSKDSSVQPRAGWLTMSCILKRKNLQTYEEAEAELANMLNKTDTDTDDQMPYLTEQKAAGPNFNSLAQNLIDPIDEIAPNETPAAENVIYDFEIVSEGTSNAAAQSLSIDGPQILEEIKNIYVIQQHVMENQDKIMKKLAEISVKVEEIINNNRQPSTVTMLAQAKGMEVESFALRPINDIGSLENLEQELSNKEIYEKLKQQYSIICSESHGNGINCAYRLLDVLFTKEFLCKCSWTGGSRNATDVKIGFKGFKNIVKFFFTMVNSWDSSYTMEQNENFFKSVLRNALKRQSMKNIRSSGKKTRRGRIDKNNENNKQNSAALRTNPIEEDQDEESLC